MKIYIIRNEVTNLDELNVILGRIDIGLSKKGRENADKIYNELKYKNIDTAYSSPLKRARETMLKVPAIKSTVTNLLDNIDFGDWEGLTRDRIGESFKNFEDAYDIIDTKIEGTIYTLRDVCNQVYKFIDLLKMTHDDNDTIAIISHSIIIDILLSKFNGMENYHFKRYNIENGEINIVDFNI